MAGYDLIVIGSGFGSLFFAKKYSELRPSDRILILERGEHHSHAWQLAQQRNSATSHRRAHKVRRGEKPWNYTLAFGGGLNCWYGQSMRFLPEDFELKSRYGVVADWPLTYGDLEEFYCDAEEIMSVSGSDRMANVSPRSRPYPVRPHRVSEPDEIMMTAQPEHHFPVATTRAPIALETRNRCCVTARCNLCPVDANFTANNGMKDLLQNDMIEVLTGAEVRRIETRAGLAERVVYRKGQREGVVEGDLVVLGANGIHSPEILLRSNISTPATGVGLCEQIGYEYEVFLDGVDNFGGSTLSTGLNFGLYGGEHRREAGAGLLAFHNHLIYGVRPEYGRWRQVLPLLLNIENAPTSDTRVVLDSDDRPLVVHPDNSEYGKRGLEHANQRLAEVLSPLPVERIEPVWERATEAHLQCSLRMGEDPETSVVDRYGLHHGVRNLIVVGSATFTTCPPANPSLTVAALAMWSAHHAAGG